MSYYRQTSGIQSAELALIIERITNAARLPQELERPLNGIWIGKPTETTQWAGCCELELSTPYLAGTDGLIAFNHKKKIKVRFQVEYQLGKKWNNLVVLPVLALPENGAIQSIFPLLAVVLFHTGGIYLPDKSTNEFVEWLINNRPKVNKVGKMDIPEENNELFKFLQLRERAGDVKITQEIGQELFKALFDRANAIAHEEVSSDALATDTSEFMLALVNNIINSAPKPATRFDRVELKDFIRMNAMYMKENGRQLLSGEDYYIAGTDEADALRVLGEPCPTVTCCKVWYFSMYGRIICRVYSAGHELVLNVARGTLLSMREQVLDDVIDMLLNSGRLNGKK